MIAVAARPFPPLRSDRSYLSIRELRTLGLGGTTPTQLPDRSVHSDPNKRIPKGWDFREEEGEFVVRFYPDGKRQQFTNIFIACTQNVIYEPEELIAIAACDQSRSRLKLR